ncbi:ImpA family type VI secretion system protein [Pseudacidovorax sp. RU35E]|uniref:type VI secretion system protein TssA n=1 Tax=Pseudacidovorax sp. RU35E TaxID=1907403 RepID=UPI000956D470|nr:type VI secretion system ImpA family N-terminal domain-containing protein [Pseudacidovorax sp. RU35E]SIR78086.1 type VI secretion system protein ImpA [Pseudacidovorax sp. RU35E]
MTHALASPTPPLAVRQTVIASADWLLPVSDTDPCGPNLEYDPEYAMLWTRLQPRGEAQYGSFIDAPDGPNWAEVERDCRRLLLRTKDLHLLICLTRARARLGQAAGLLQGLEMLVQALRAWPDDIHPQTRIDGEHEPAVRANALAALADPQGLLADIREITVDTGAGVALSVRDVERAFAMPRPEGARSPDSVRRQLTALRRAAQGNPEVPVHQLAAACRHAQAVAAWARSQLGDLAPDLQPLLQLLEVFVPSAEDLDAVAAATGAPLLMPAQPGAPAERRLAVGIVAAARPVTREDALEAIRQSREWFELHEPSSPVPALLRLGERMVGRRFSEVADWVPLDLLRRWEAADEESQGGRA